MRFAVTTGAAGPCDPAVLADLAAVAERSGWDGFFLEDYIVYQGRAIPTYDPWVCLAAIACATKRIRIGTTVTPVSRRRPWKLALEAASVDQLSGGRLILGVGIGDSQSPDFRATGEPTDPCVLAERLDEGLQIIVALWNGDRIHHNGRQYRIDGLQSTNVPVQHPRIPIWIGGNILAPTVRRRMARWDGVCGYKGAIGSGAGPITPQDVRDLLDFVTTERGSVDDFDVKVSGTDDPDEITALAEAGATWWGQWVDPTHIESLRDTVHCSPPIGNNLT